MAEERYVSLTDYMNLITNTVIAFRNKGLSKDEALQKITFPNDNETIKTLNEEITERVYAMPIEMIN